MRISVLVACWNAERYLGEALASALDQNPAPAEVIVVDDGSTDGSAAVASGFAGVTLVSQPNRGVAAALNRAARHATGEVLTFLDADDLWLPGKLATQVAALRADPGLDGVFAHMRSFVDPALPEADRTALRVEGAVEPGLVKGTLMLRAAALGRLGPFDEERRFADFIAWYVAASAKGFRWAMLPDLLYLRRVHGGNMGRRERERQHEQYLLAMKDLIDRRRAPGTSSA